MEELFLAVYHGRLSLDVMGLSIEERRWWIERAYTETAKKEEARGR